MAPDFPGLLERFRNGPTVIDAALAMGPNDTDRADGEGWTVRDVLVHLADAELVRSVRIRLILAEDSPRLFEFDEGTWRERLGYGVRDPVVALRLYREAVASTHDLLSAAATSSWSRAGMHPTDGLLSVTMLIERGIRHAADHAAQLRGILGQ